MYLFPHLRTGHNICPYATPSCSKDCLVDTGNLLYPSVRRAMISKTLLWVYFPEFFLNLLVSEILRFKLESDFSEKKPAIRLNGASDIPWHKYLDLEKIFKDTGIRFYDYTKYPYRDGLPSRDAYSVTFSISEHPKSWERAFKWLDQGYSAAGLP